MSVLLDQHGRAISLGKRLGAGGEAVAYEMGDDPSQVVKIYHEPVNHLKARKLVAMVAMACDQLDSFAAWPTAVVTDQKRKQVFGIILPRVRGMEIHSLYTPANRKKSFPEADWKYLARVAHNFAAGVQALHQNGIVIGDINQGNTLVGDDALVKMIDCDSFQIRKANRIYRCEVGVPHFTPPELQGVALSEVDRTTNHDGFGMAVMIFHLLFLGRHPFVGRYYGSGELPLEEAILRNRFCYGKLRSTLQMEPPPHSLMMEELTPKVAELFERAFAANTAGSQRPLSSEWCEALKNFESTLVECDRDHGHYYVSDAQCPWCRIENSGGPKFFATVSDDWHRMRRDEKGESRVVRTIDAFSVDLQKFLDPPRPISCDVHETVASHGEMNSGWMQKLLGYGVLISAFACLLGFFWWVLWVIFVPSSLVMALTYLIFDYFSQAKSELRYLKFMIKKSGTELHEFYRNSRMEIASLENHARKLKNLVRTARIDLELLDETWSNGLYQGLQAEDLEPIREPRTQMNLHHR